MIGKYGKTTLMNDPEFQKKLLAGRRISGEYLWQDKINKTQYVGSYEKSFLQFLDEVLNFDPNDVMAPSPHVYYYIYDGRKHFYMPDMYIPSLELEIEIKDGGDNANTHPKIIAVDKEKERLKDEVLKSSTFDYIKIINKNNMRFLEYLDRVKYNSFNNIKEHIIMIDDK